MSLDRPVILNYLQAGDRIPINRGTYAGSIAIFRNWTDDSHSRVRVLIDGNQHTIHATSLDINSQVTRMVSNRIGVPLARRSGPPLPRNVPLSELMPELTGPNAPRYNAPSAIAPSNPSVSRSSRVQVQGVPQRSVPSGEGSNSGPVDVNDPRFAHYPRHNPRAVAVRVPGQPTRFLAPIRTPIGDIPHPDARPRTPPGDSDDEDSDSIGTSGLPLRLNASCQSFVDLSRHFSEMSIQMNNLLDHIETIQTEVDNLRSSNRTLRNNVRQLSQRLGMDEQLIQQHMQRIQELESQLSRRLSDNLPPLNQQPTDDMVDSDDDRKPPAT
jgi:regulator of replication initiation timing